MIGRCPLSFLHYGLYLATHIVFYYLTNLNHHTSSTSANLILLFWPNYALVSAIRIRTIILSGEFSPGRSPNIPRWLSFAHIALWLSSVGLGLIDFCIELYSRKKRWTRIRWRSFWSWRRRIMLEEEEAEDVFSGWDGTTTGESVQVNEI